MLPHPPGWHPEDTKAALRKLGWTQQRNADELDLCRRTVLLTIQNGRARPKTLKTLRARLGQNPLLFPGPGVNVCLLRPGHGGVSQGALEFWFR